MAKSAALSAETRSKNLLPLLRRAYPDARTALAHRSPFELLIATILSAQCTDERVNIVTRELFAKYRGPEDFAGASQAQLEKDIHSTGFFRMKAKNIIACSRALMECHQGVVPSTMDELVHLPGVGRKTANVVLSEAFGKSEGVVVDTHVHRVSQRLGLTRADQPEKIEQDLMSIFDRKEWGEVGGLLIHHGRRICIARKPKCPECPVLALCPSAEVFLLETSRIKKQER
ncbi:endonuclease III [bacterium]|nr:MAG: endonuclease III [bacterium]